MHPILKNILAVLAGVIAGSAINLLLVGLNEPVFGVTFETIEELKGMKVEHQIFPFLGHAIGTLVGAFIAAKIAATSKMKLVLAMIIGIWFLIGGTMMAHMLDYPMPFTAIDLLLAYLPMGWLGGKLATGS